MKFFFWNFECPEIVTAVLRGGQKPWSETVVRNEEILIGPKLQLIDYPPTVYKASAVNNNHQVCKFSTDMYKLIN